MHMRLLSWVAPHTGAWIETKVTEIIVSADTSHPTRVRGLKQPYKINLSFWHVAPHTGAWIETVTADVTSACACRTPHGCVD